MSQNFRHPEILALAKQQNLQLVGAGNTVVEHAGDLDGCPPGSPGAQACYANMVRLVGDSVSTDLESVEPWFVHVLGMLDHDIVLAGCA